MTNMLAITAHLTASCITCKRATRLQSEYLMAALDGTGNPALCLLERRLTAEALHHQAFGSLIDSPESPLFPLLESLPRRSLPLGG